MLTLGTVFSPTTFGLPEKIEWSVASLLLLIVGPVVVSRTLRSFYPKEPHTRARMRRAWDEGLLSQTRGNVGALWFGLGCIMMSIMIAVIVLIPAWFG